MTEVLARIDITTPRGREIVRELNAEKCVKVEYPMPEGFIASTTTVNEAFDQLEQKLEAYYKNGSL